MQTAKSHRAAAAEAAQPAEDASKREKGRRNSEEVLFTITYYLLLITYYFKIRGENMATTPHGRFVACPVGRIAPTMIGINLRVGV